MTADHFERIYRRHARDVYRFALAVVRDPADAEDVTQTTFLNAYRALKRGHEPQRVNSWLLAIAHNAIRSRHRFTLRRPREVPLEAALHQLAVPPEERPGVAEVLEALGDLPEAQRTALALREVGGRSYPEIAETLGLSVPAVESLIFRARRTLRKHRTNLRGLTVVQLPRSLRGFLEQGDAAATGLVTKAAVALAAAGAIAGGMAGSDAGASRKAETLRPTPSRPQAATIAFERPVPARPSSAAPRARPAPASPAAPARLPAPAAVPPVRDPAPAGTTTPPGRTGPAPEGQGQPAAGGGGPTTVQGPDGSSITFEKLQPPTPPTAPTLPTLPTLPTVPTSPDPSTWTMPEPPTPPTLPMPPTAPTPPSVPQVKPPGGIN